MLQSEVQAWQISIGIDSETKRAQPRQCITVRTCFPVFGCARFMRLTFSAYEGARYWLVPMQAIPNAMEEKGTPISHFVSQQIGAVARVITET